MNTQQSSSNGITTASGQSDSTAGGLSTAPDADLDLSTTSPSRISGVIALPASAPRAITLPPASRCGSRWLTVMSTGASTVQVADGGGNIGAAIASGAAASYYSDGIDWTKMGLLPN